MAINYLGNVGIGITNPSGKLHILDGGISKDSTSSISGGLVIQSNTGSRNITNGAQIEFVIPANSDGSNLYGQGRIITVAGNTNTSNATGKMILGTKRNFNKLGAGSSWYYGDDLTIDGSGYVGIGTSTPNDLLTIGANTTLPANQSTIGTGHNSTQTYSSDDSYALTNVGYVQAVASAIILGTATSTATTSMTTIAKFSVVSVSANGSNDGIKGYARANTLCKDAVTDSHVCTSFEILFSIAAGVTMPNENVWIFNGPPGYTASSNDCEGRTSAAASSYGAYWEKPTSPSYPQGRGLLGRCNTSLKLACCK
jgi:hypothetical protein